MIKRGVTEFKEKLNIDKNLKIAIIIDNNIMVIFKFLVNLIYSELYNLHKESAITIITRVRKNPRNIKYTQKKSDGSIEENRKLMDTDAFIEFIKSGEKHLIF